LWYHLKSWICAQSLCFNNCETPCTTVPWKNIEETRWQFSWKDPQFSWWVQSIVYPQIMCFPWLF